MVGLTLSRLTDTETPSVIHVSNEASRPTGDLASSGSRVSASSVITLKDQSYYVDGVTAYDLDLSLPSNYEPTTVMRFDGDVTVDAIRSSIHHFENVDDVFSRTFLSLIIFELSPGATKELSSEVNKFLHSLGTRFVGILDEGSQNADRGLPDSGPYFASPRGLFGVWKLYPDTFGAFVLSTVPTVGDANQYAVLNVTCAAAGSNLAIAVPSRLYFKVTKEKPLNGLRVSIKDNIDVQGVKTSGMCRSYFHLYPPAAKSAYAVQQLVDLGAVIVGKTGLNQFADAEDPTGDYVDYHCPFNPRGDGYRSPGGSSSGAGAATAAYDWLDVSVGTDTGGSVRVPAATQGVFGIRPSRGQMSVEGSLVIHRDLDTIGIISRDLDMLRAVSEQLYADFPPEPEEATPQNLVKNLLYPFALFQVLDKDLQSLYETTVSSIENVLGVKRKEIDLEKLWKEYRGTLTTESLESYFGPILYDYVIWGSYHERAKFREDYMAKFGRNPYVNPPTQFRWELGVKMSSDHFDLIKAKRAKFQSFIEQVFGEDSIMIRPFSNGEPDSRDIYRPRPPERDAAEFGIGLRPAFQAPYAGQPEVVFPIGQLPVKSAFSGRTEYYAVTASITGWKGSDAIVTKIARLALDQAGLPLRVATGATPYPTKEDLPLIEHDILFEQDGGSHRRLQE